MPVEVICTIITVVGTVISALIAWFVSRSSASKEIERMKLEWARQDIVSSDDEFAEMSSAVSQYISHSNGVAHRDAIRTVAALRAKESGALASALDDLYSSLSETKDFYQANKARISACLTQVIQQKRAAKSH